MKKTFLITFMLCFVLQATLLAQSKSERRIYLWDVTRSMNGKMGVNGKEVDDPEGVNIYADVVNFLEREINSIIDENTELVVMPFKTDILDTWSEKATESGKKSMISKIRNYDNTGLSGTNIVRPITYTQNNVIKNDKRNLLFLLTDGRQTGGNADLLPLIRNWEQYAKINDAYAVYVMLTQESIDNEVIAAIKQTDDIDVVTEPGKTNFIELQPAEHIKFNIKDNEGKPATVSVTCKKNIVVPENIKFKVTAEDNPYFAVEPPVVLKDGRIALNVKYLQTYDSLKIVLAESTKLNLHIELANSEEIKQNTGNIILLTQKDIVLELINKHEMTLKISIKK
jgi:hypothetical protein